MGLSRTEAYDILELPIGADPDSIRTSYKRLASKWHPTKHENSAEATRKFKDISLAYKRLTTDNEDVHITLTEMFELFQQIFYPKHSAYSNGYTTSDDDDEDDDLTDEDDDLECFSLKTKQDIRRRQDGHSSRQLTAEEIEKNANELITEEEKEKRRAEKRRAKKKRRREKKRLEKQQAEQHKKEDDHKKKSGKVKNGDHVKSKKQDKKSRDSSGSEAEEFDPSAAFFTQVVNKKKKSGVLQDPVTPSSRPKQTNARQQNKNDEDIEELDPVVLRSRQLAIGGNEMANVGHYQAAIDLFTDAIKLDPRDFRFFGNRSYCFDRIQQYERALKDADKAIGLAPDWPKGYFRKGRALAGLKLYADAEQAFMQVLKLDRNCEDAIQELLRVRTHQLTEMGFSRQQAEQAIRQHGTVQQALDSLLAGVVAENSLSGEVYVSDEEDYSPVNPQQPSPVPATLPLPVAQQKPADSKMDPCNPEGLTALWVGNVLPEVTDKKLIQMFSKYGSVTSVRLLPEKYCAFINFKTKESAGRAMHTLQGMECAGQRLLIKFPDNPITNGNVVIRKGQQNKRF